MNGETYELLTLFESIFQLDGQAVITEGEKHITLSKNFKEPKLMKKLEEAMPTVNEMKMINLDGRHMKFQMGPAQCT
ncbi:MAG: acetolactate decarboxylase [Cytophagales bacterium]|nr:acetolactate decarboxylase [Cytophagales bacterium]